MLKKAKSNPGAVTPARSLPPDSGSACAEAEIERALIGRNGLCNYDSICLPSDSDCIEKSYSVPEVDAPKEKSENGVLSIHVCGKCGVDQWSLISDN